MVDVEVGLEELQERLAPLDVLGLRRMTGGASSLTYAGAIGGDAAQRVVVKVAPAGVPPVLNRDVLRQARVLRALRPTAVPVPDVLWEDAGEPPDVPPLFVMPFVEGASVEPLFDRVGEASPSDMAARMRDAARVMAGLHALHPDELGLGGEPRVELSAEVDRWCRLLDTVDAALAPEWQSVAASLRDSEPSSSAPTLVHGDFRLGNMLAVGPRVAAVIDWEIWSVSDPRVDVGWFLVNADPDTYRRETEYESSLPGPAELLETYAGSLGRGVADLAWFQALALFKSVATWALIIKHNRRRATPVQEIEAVVPALPRLLARAHAHLR